VSWFTLAYAFGYLGAGRLMDEIGTRLGFAVSVVVWSLAAIAAFVCPDRYALWIGACCARSGRIRNFPASIKTVAEWFPVRERAFATGIFNAGSTSGDNHATLRPVDRAHLGMAGSFHRDGPARFHLVGVLAADLSPPSGASEVSAGELALIQSDPRESTIPVKWSALLSNTESVGDAIGKFMTDPIWWFYLYWLPSFSTPDTDQARQRRPAADRDLMCWPMSDRFFGGWLSGALISRRWSVNAARKTTMLIAAVAIVPTMFAPAANGVWLSVAIVGLAAAAHQWWSANIFTLASDMFRAEHWALVVGIGGFAGAMGGVVFQRVTGSVLQSNGHDYTPIFIVCGLAYVSALLIIQPAGSANSASKRRHQQRWISGASSRSKVKRPW